MTGGAEDVEERKARNAKRHAARGRAPSRSERRPDRHASRSGASAVASPPSAKPVWLVRRWRLDDLSALAKFVCSRKTSGTYAKQAQRVLREAADEIENPEVDGLVAIKTLDSLETIVGVIVFQVPSIGSTSQIYGLGVNPNHWREGIGIDLKRRALDVCSARGIEIVASKVHRNNFKMQGLNAKLGIRYAGDPADGKNYLYGARLLPGPDL